MVGAVGHELCLVMRKFSKSFNKQSDSLTVIATSVWPSGSGDGLVENRVRWCYEAPFLRKRSQNFGQIYQSDVLEKVVKPLNETLFVNKPWSSQQDFVSASKAKTSQVWLKNNLGTLTSLRRRIGRPAAPT